MAMVEITSYIANSGTNTGHYMTDWQAFLDRERTILITDSLHDRVNLTRWTVELRHPTTGRILGEEGDIVYFRTKIYVGDIVSDAFDF